MSTMAHKYMNVVIVKKNGFNNLKTDKMRDLLLKWWNRTWSNWEQDREYFSWDTYSTYIVLKRVSNDGLIQFKVIKKV